jgi:ketosteroid isomerase-like protein
MSTLLTLFLLAGGPVPGQGLATPADSTAAVEFSTFADQWRRAYNGADSLALAGFYLPDAQYISGHVPGLVAEGRTRVIENFLKGVRSGGHVDDLTLLSTEISGELAVIQCSYRATNAGQRAAGRNLLVLRQVNGKWLIRLHVTVV